MLSSVFFLANGLSKAGQGLVEFDKVMSNIEKAGLEDRENQQLYIKFHKELDEILARYF
jgi:hypothetical protein